MCTNFEARDGQGTTILMHAVRRGMSGLVHKLAAQSDLTRQVDFAGRNALFYAMEAPLSVRKRLFQVLLLRGADPLSGDAQGVTRQSFLQACVQRGESEYFGLAVTRLKDAKEEEQWEVAMAVLQSGNQALREALAAHISPRSLVLLEKELARKKRLASVRRRLWSAESLPAASDQSLASEPEDNCGSLAELSVRDPTDIQNPAKIHERPPEGTTAERHHHDPRLEAEDNGPTDAEARILRQRIAELEEVG